MESLVLEGLVEAIIFKSEDTFPKLEGAAPPAPDAKLETSPPSLLFD